SVTDWLVCTAILLVGLFLAGLYIHIRLQGMTTEDELTLVEGIPGDVTITEQPQGVPSGVEFDLAGYSAQYSSDGPRFEEGLATVQSGQPLRMWVSTRQEAIVRHEGRVPLYKLTVGNRVVLTYDEVIAHEWEGPKAVLIVGVAISVVGIWGVYLGPF